MFQSRIAPWLILLFIDTYLDVQIKDGEFCANYILQPHHYGLHIVHLKTASTVNGLICLRFPFVA